MLLPLHIQEAFIAFALRKRKQMVHSWAVFTSLPTSVCLFFCLSGPVMHCNPRSGMGYSKALQLHYAGTVWWLEGALAGMQPNCRSILTETLRLQCLCWNMSSFPLPPLTPKARQVCAASPVPYHISPPHLCNHLANFSQRGSSLLTISDTHNTYFVSISVRCCLLLYVSGHLSAREEQPVFPPPIHSLSNEGEVMMWHTGSNVS